jgi:hypothetical protein
MTPYWYIQNDFLEKRSRRVGASDVSALIPNPEKPNESLAGYERTAVTVWEEKTGRRALSSVGLPAEMGHWNEVKAIELFIRDIDAPMSREYALERLRYEMLLEQDPRRRPSAYQSTPFKHNTQWYNDDFIVHPDGVYEGGALEPCGKAYPLMRPASIIAHGYSIDLFNPFLIEAKTASYWSAKRLRGSLVSGYDFDLRTWQGIPLKHFVQIQFQLACLDAEVCYLPLLYDASSFHVWEIRRDRKTGDSIIDLAGRMAWHIKHDEPPKEMAMNAMDISALYPTLTDDFRMLPEDATDAAIEAARKYRRAKAQEKAWKQKADDASDALACYLKDTKEIRVLRDGEIVPIAKWIEKKGGERVIGLKDIEALTDGEKLCDTLRDAGAIKTGEASRCVGVMLKDDEEEEEE